MGILKSAWKLLTEDPSKNVKVEVNESNISKVSDLGLIHFREREVEGLAIQKPTDSKNEDKVTKKRLPEKLYELKNNTSPDIYISEIAIGKPVYYPSYPHTSYDVHLFISGRSLFNGLSQYDRQFMGIGNFTGTRDDLFGVMEIDYHTSKVKHVELVISVSDLESSVSDLFSDDTTLYDSRVKSITVTRESINGVMNSRNIYNRLSSSNTNLYNVIFGYNELVKKSIESDFMSELDEYKKLNEVKSIINDFNENINTDVLMDLFSYTSDIIDSDKFNIQLVEGPRPIHHWDKNIQKVTNTADFGNYYKIHFDVNKFYNNGLFDLSGSFPNLLMEIGEATNRLNDIHKCNSEMNISGGKIMLIIKPIFPNWLTDLVDKHEKYDLQRATRQSIDRLNRHYRMGFND